MTTCPFVVKCMPGDHNGVVISMIRNDNLGLVAINVPRAKTQSVKNMMNLLAHRNVTEGQVVFSDYIEFKTVEAKGEIRSDTMKQIIPNMTEKITRIMMLVPCHASHASDFNSCENPFIDLAAGGRKEQAAM
jgi:hypothetical protein